MHLQVRISLVRKVKQRYMPMFGIKNVTIDMCRYFKGMSSSNLMDMVIGDVRKYTNVAHPCPFSVRISYNMVRFV